MGGVGWAAWEEPCGSISGVTGEVPVHSIPFDLKAQCGSGDQRSGRLLLEGLCAGGAASFLVPLS